MTTISLKANMKDLNELHNLLMSNGNLCLDNDYCYKDMTDQEKAFYDADEDYYMLLREDPKQINNNNLVYYYIQKQAYVDSIRYSLFMDDIERGITDIDDPINQDIVEYGSKHFPKDWKFGEFVVDKKMSKPNNYQISVLNDEDERSVFDIDSYLPMNDLVVSIVKTIHEQKKRDELKNQLAHHQEVHLIIFENDEDFETIEELILIDLNE